MSAKAWAALASDNPLREILERKAAAEPSLVASREDRERTLDAAERLWRRSPDLRLGQMLVQAVGVAFGASVDVDLSVYDTEQWRLAFGRRLEVLPDGDPPKPDGPVWDTESATGRTFNDGLPRDPARIESVLGALRAAWEGHPDLPLGAIVQEASQGWYVKGVEDAKLRAGLNRLAGRGP